MHAARIALLLLGVIARGAPYVVYEHSDGSQTFNLSRCAAYVDGGDTAAQRRCVLHQPVLRSWPQNVDMTIEHDSRDYYVCTLQRDVCRAIAEHQDRSDECVALFGGCRAALRHLHRMMFADADPADAGVFDTLDDPEQVCNNFARKSIRGFFHDFMSNHIDGSLLSEHNVSMNFGLCRWAQYVNVLSDETRCDPGSIVAMAGELGYLACGVSIWELDVATHPDVTIGRPHPCGQNIDDATFDLAVRQRRDAFSDTQTAVNATAMEELWYAANGHSHPAPDGEAEYSAEASDKCCFYMPAQWELP
jgi:hypothetical protein